MSIFFSSQSSTKYSAAALKQQDTKKNVVAKKTQTDSKVVHVATIHCGPIFTYKHASNVLLSVNFKYGDICISNKRVSFYISFNDDSDSSNDTAEDSDDDASLKLQAQYGDIYTIFQNQKNKTFTFKRTSEYRPERNT